METNYQQQGIDFLKATDTKMTVVFVENGIYFDDARYRDIFKVAFKRDKKSFSFKFGQSLKESTGTGDNPPSSYDVLTCLTKYDVGPFEEFCSEFGYDDLKLSEYPKIKRIYKACIKEYKNICKLWNKEEIAKMQEIN